MSRTPQQSSWTGTPTFSVITPSFNQGRYIERTIRSVLEQDYPAVEHIVIDGGSTDETQQVLRAFPHLTVICEPDEGQADALNKGLSRATGDIVAWINSDDWYARGVFHDVAAALRHYPVVMGACDIVDGDEKFIYQVANIERTWFDMLKYWIPYSIPTQPAMFLRRDALEAVRRLDGSYVDKSLYYVMDYDLWMRIANRYPFFHRLQRVCSYYRMTEDNKTSHKVSGMAYAEPEMSRVFKRAQAERFPSDSVLSILISTESASDLLRQTLTSIEQASFYGLETVVSFYGADNAEYKAVSRLIKEHNGRLNATRNDSYARLTRATTYSFSGALEKGLLEAAAPIILALEPGVMIETLTPCKIMNAFASDRVGIVIPTRPGASLSEDPLTSLLALSAPYWNVCARRAAMQELLPLVEGSKEFSFKTMALQAWCSGWSVAQNVDIGLHWNDRAQHTLLAEEISLEDRKALRDYTIAALVLITSQRSSRSPFAALRQQFRASLSFPPEALEASKRVLAAGPPQDHLDAVRKTVPLLELTPP